MLSVTPSVQSPSAYDRNNLSAAQLGTRLAAGANATLRDDLRTASEDVGYRQRIHADETAAGLVAADLDFGYDPGVFTRYRGSQAAAAGTNTTALQAALDSNQTVEIHELGVHNFNDTILFNDNNRIVGRGKGTILKWNVTNKALLRGVDAATTRRYRFGMRDLLLDNTDRANVGAIALDLENLTLGCFENVEVQNVEKGVKIYASDGAFYNHFFSCGFLTVSQGIQIGALANENVFVSCRIGDTTHGVEVDDNSGNAFYSLAVEEFTGVGFDVAPTAPALYTIVHKPRFENVAAGASIGFRLDAADARSTTIVGPHLVNLATNYSGEGLDTLLLSGETNSPELRANRFAFGQGNLDNSSYALLKGSGASVVDARSAADDAFADVRVEKLLANAYLDIGGNAAAVNAGRLAIGRNTQATVGAAGGASALPATPTGYIRIFLGATEYVIPYYAQA